MKELVSNYIYIPGQYPIPMIAIYNEQNQNIFNDQNFVYTYGKFINQYEHIWNMNAYIIYDKQKNKIISYSFENIYYFLWLLRTINLPLTMIFEQKTIEENQNFFKETINELGCL